MPGSDQGVQNKRFKIVPRTLIFLFDGKDRVLLLKGSQDKPLWAGLLNGIGGHVERGEDILESALRELAEETGIKDLPLRYCGQIMIDVEEALGVGLFIFRGLYQGDEFSPSHEGRLLWVPVISMAGEKFVEDLPILVPLVHKHEPGDPCIIGKYSYDADGNLQISFG